ncbi:MAG: CoA-binding protein [Firmicutes bacterium]|nr:CoA-binding protein [Bacillota bacterium]
MTGLDKLFKPVSIAVLGASKTPGKIGHAVVRNILDSGYQGSLYPVNPKEEMIEELDCYSNVAEIPVPVDLAVISVPARFVCEAAETCGKAGVKGLVVISAGFKEIGAEGLEMEKNLISICRDYKMQMLGPNCVGLMDTHTPLNASFAGAFPERGEIAFLSQSGAMLIAILDWSISAGLGFSKIVSLGNKGDLSEIEFIEDAAQDPNTKVILCYIEDIIDGERFLEVAGRAAKEKPVIVLKSGTSQAGAQAASSHTGALAGSDLAYDTAFKQCGIIRARSMTELFDLAATFAKSPVPRGKRVAIVTNSGGPGIIATDNVENNGLQMARFTKSTIEELQANLPVEAGIYNPVDVLGDAKAERYHFALQKVCADPNVDSVLMLMCPTSVTESDDTAKALIETRDAYPDKAIFAANMGGETLSEATRLLSRAGIPCFTFPEPALNAIRGMVDYSDFRASNGQQEDQYHVDVDKRAVKAIFYDVLKDNRLVLLGSEASEVARAYGIAAAPVVLATTPDQAAAEAEKMGYPVVLKVASPKILHKTDVGGVQIGLKSAEEVKNAFMEIMDNVKRYLPRVVVHGIEVQKMMPKGTELIIGMTKDIQFGPLIAFGLGGIYVNLLKDVSFRLAKGLTPSGINSMFEETKAYSLLRGYRGAPPADTGAVQDVVSRVARLVLDFPEITEIDMNPLIAYKEGISVLDVKITIS